MNNMLSGNEYGNPAIFGDYIFEKLENKRTAVRSAIIAREAGRLDYCKRRFLETLSRSLEKGPVGLQQVHNEQTILHRNGIEASAQLYDDVVFNFVYLPKRLTK